MKLSRHNEWLSLIANFGVIIGIIFLIVEVRQTNELMESERRYNRLQVSLEGNGAYIENPMLNDALRKIRSGDELSENELIAMEFQMVNIFNVWQWTWIELGGTDEYPLAQYREAIQLEGIRGYWEQRKDYLLPEFVQFVEENIVSY